MGRFFLFREVDKGCPDKGCNESREMQGLTYGCLCRRRATPILDANFSKPIHAFYSLFFIAFSSRS
jgi:hypothetical protein